MWARCPVCGVIYLSGNLDSLNMQQRTWDMQMKCYDTNCYAKSRPPSPEIENCDLDKTLYNAYILPIMLYASECWTVDAQCINALDQWCLRRILDIRWHDFIRNDVVHQMTQQSSLSSIVKSRWLSLFRMNELADAANRILFVQLLDNWRRPPGRPHSTWVENICNRLSSFGMEVPEAREAAQNWLF